MVRHRPAWDTAVRDGKVVSCCPSEVRRPSRSPTPSLHAFLQLISGASSRKSIKLVKYFKIPKLLRVSRVMKFLRNHRYVYDFTRVILVLLTALHLGACIWVALVNPCDASRDGYAGREVCAQANVYNVYAEALHLSATMILGVSNLHILGKPQLVNLSLEGREGGGAAVYLVGTLYMTIGLFLIALLISEANSYLLGVKQGSAAFQLKSDRISHELEYYSVPQDLQRQVKAYFDYVWINQKQVSCLVHRFFVVIAEVLSHPIPRARLSTTTRLLSSATIRCRPICSASWHFICSRMWVSGKNRPLAVVFLGAKSRSLSPRQYPSVRSSARSTTSF